MKQDEQEKESKCEANRIRANELLNLWNYMNLKIIFKINKIII